MTSPATCAAAPRPKLPGIAERTRSERSENAFQGLAFGTFRKAALAGHDRPKGCTTPYCGPPPKLCAVQCVTAPLHDIYVISDLYTLPPRVARRLPDLTIASRNGAICSCLKRGLCGLAIRLGCGGVVPLDDGRRPVGLLGAAQPATRRRTLSLLPALAAKHLVVALLDRRDGRLELLPGASWW